MRKFAIVLTVAALCAGALAQNEGRATRRPLGNQSGTPVRISEVNFTINKYEKVIRKVLGMPGSSAAIASKDTKPASRALILSGLNRLFEMTKPEFKITPRETKLDGNHFAIPRGAQNRGVLEKLVKWGFVGKVSPLATSKSDTLTLAEFGDTMGYFLMRVADLTHTPSAKWSPYLQGTQG